MYDEYLKSRFNFYDIEIAKFRKKNLILVTNTICVYVLSLCWIFVTFDFLDVIGFDSISVFVFSGFDFSVYDTVKNVFFIINLAVFIFVSFYYRTLGNVLKLTRLSLISNLITRKEFVIYLSKTKVKLNDLADDGKKINIKCFNSLVLNVTDILSLYDEIFGAFTEARKKTVWLIFFDIVAVFVSCVIIKDGLIKTVIPMIFAYAGVIKYQYGIFCDYNVAINSMIKFKLELMDSSDENGEINSVSFGLILSTLYEQDGYHSSLIRTSMEYLLFRADSFLIKK